MTSGSNDVSTGTDLAAALDATGLPATVKGKVQKAIFRLIAGGMGLEYWDKIRDNLDAIDGRTRVNMILAEHVGRQALADPEIVERAKARFLGDLAQKQENVEAVARLANEAAGASPDGDNPSADEAPEPSQDWMNTFIREAEGASSDDLRERLAGVLAGEARKPGTFSRSTVRFIAEAEKSTLQAFEQALEHRSGDAVIKGKDWDSGEWFGRGIALEGEGLLTGVSAGSTQKEVQIGENGTATLFTGRLGLHLEGPAGLKKTIPCWILTKVGMEVASLLKPTNELAAFTRMGDLIDKAGLTKVSVVVGMPDGKGGLALHAVNVPWQSEPAS